MKSQPMNSADAGSTPVSAFMLSSQVPPASSQRSDLSCQTRVVTVEPKERIKK